MSRIEVNWEKNEKIPSKICSQLRRNQRVKFHFFIRMRWVSIRWTPLLSIQSTCVILRRVSFSLFALLFACNFHEIKLTFSFFLFEKVKNTWNDRDCKIQSKRKKKWKSILFLYLILIAFCYIHVFIQCLNTCKSFIFLFSNLLAFVSIFNAVYFKCSIYAYLFNKFLHNQLRGCKFCHFWNLKYS